MMKSSVVTVILTALCAWLGWTAYDETKRPVPTTDRNGRAVGANTAQNPDNSEPEKMTIVFPSLEALGDMVSRPLFNVSRRPIAVEKTISDEKPAVLNLMLSGIVIGQARQIAHLRSAFDRQTLALSVGDKIGDWQIQSIFPDRVVLRSGGRIETLFMQKPGAKNTATGVPGAAGAKRSSRRPSTRSKRNQRRFKRDAGK